MELSPEKLHGGDALLRRARKPETETRPLSSFLVERRQTSHTLQMELHFFQVYMVSPE